MKRRCIIFVVCFMIIVAVKAECATGDKDNVNEVTCSLSIKGKKMIFKRGKKIEFIGKCSRENDEDIFMPRKFMQGSADFRPNIILENENGKRYAFIYYQYAYTGMNSSFKAIKSGDAIFDFVFPDQKERYKVVDLDVWEKIPAYDVEQRMKVFKEAQEKIPAGKYKAWLNINYDWKTVIIGNIFMVLDNYNNYDNRGNVVSWSIKDSSSPVEFEVK